MKPAGGQGVGDRMQLEPRRQGLVRRGAGSGITEGAMWPDSGWAHSLRTWEARCCLYLLEEAAQTWEVRG